MDRCSGSERRPNLDHHISNPSPHFDPAAGAFLRRPTVPRRLGRKTSRCPRHWRGGPDRHFSVGRQPQPAGWVPGPATVAHRDGFPGTPFCFLHAFRAVSPLSVTTQLCLEVMTGVRPTHPPHCWPTALACVHPLRRPGTRLGVFGIQLQHRVSFPGQHRIGHTHFWHSEHRSRSSSHLLQISHRHQRLQCGVDGIGVSSGWKAPSRQALPLRKNSRSPQASASMPLARAWDSVILARIGSAVSNDTWRSIPSGTGSDTVAPPWALSSPLTATPDCVSAASICAEARGRGSSSPSGTAPPTRWKSRTGSFCSSLSALLLSSFKMSPSSIDRSSLEPD